VFKGRKGRCQGREWPPEHLLDLRFSGASLAKGQVSETREPTEINDLPVVLVGWAAKHPGRRQVDDGKIVDPAWPQYRKVSGLSGVCPLHLQPQWSTRSRFTRKLQTADSLTVLLFPPVIYRLPCR